MLNSNQPQGVNNKIKISSRNDLFLSFEPSRASNLWVGISEGSIGPKQDLEIDGKMDIVKCCRCCLDPVLVTKPNPFLFIFSSNIVLCSIYFVI
jgi:hypothetical protein